jgi:hypothetical protein
MAKPPMFGTWDEMIVTVPAGQEPPPPEWHKWVYGGGRNPLKDIHFQDRQKSAPLRLVTPPTSGGTE